MTKPMMFASLMLAGGLASAACYTPLGRIDATQTSPAEATGTANFVLGSNRYFGTIEGVVAAVSGGFPSKILYTFESQRGNLTATGRPALTSVKPYGACGGYSLTIPVTINSGSLERGGKFYKTTGKFTVKGVVDCEGVEQYSITSGWVCY